MTELCFPCLLCFFFFQAEDGIRDLTVTEFRRVLFRSLAADWPRRLGRPLINLVEPRARCPARWWSYSSFAQPSLALVFVAPLSCWFCHARTPRLLGRLVLLGGYDPRNAIPPRPTHLRFHGSRFQPPMGSAPGSADLSPLLHARASLHSSNFPLTASHLRL